MRGFKMHGSNRLHSTRNPRRCTMNFAYYQLELYLIIAKCRFFLAFLRLKLTKSFSDNIVIHMGGVINERQLILVCFLGKYSPQEDRILL